jgi:glycosyltransferase involved in cell wall biosynthesis
MDVAPTRKFARAVRVGRTDPARRDMRAGDEIAINFVPDAATNPRNLSAKRPAIACFATQGTDSGDERRIIALLDPLRPTLYPFNRGRKGRSALSLLRRLLRDSPDLVVMEGTGVAGGIAVLLARFLRGIRFVVSSGDAVGPYLRLRSRWLAVPGALYERVLCGACSGFIGWSPYLAGRALTYGAPRAMTAANWAEGFDGGADRAAARKRFGIPDDALVFGLVGSLTWNRRVEYCYGLELVRAVLNVDRPDIYVLIVGDGNGRQHLAKRAGSRLGQKVLLPGRLRPEEMPEALAAMDVASLPQSVDRVGSFRYTTKISQYLSAGLPVVTGQIPLAYDLDDGWLWRLPGEAPWDSPYVNALSELMSTVTVREVAERAAVTPQLSTFQLPRQQRQVCEFLADVAARFE